MQYKREIQNIIIRLRCLRGQIKEQAEEIEQKIRRYDMLRDLTEAEERDADALNDQQEVIEDQLGAIESALDALSCFNVLN